MSKRVRTVWTPAGQKKGPMNSLVGKGESIINYNTGKATLVTKGRVGVDNQPSSVKSSDDNVIAGNDVDWIRYYMGEGSSQRSFRGPQTFAQEVAPITTQIQAINALEKKFEANSKKSNLDSLAKQTSEMFGNKINQKKQPLLQAAKEITDRQQVQHELEHSPEFVHEYRYGKDIERFYDADKYKYYKWNAWVPDMIKQDYPMAITIPTTSTTTSSEDDDIMWYKDLPEQNVTAKYINRYGWYKPEFPNWRGLESRSNISVNVPTDRLLPEEEPPVEKIEKTRTTPKWWQKLKNIKGENFARWATEALPMGLNALQANYWRNQKIHTPNVYANNPYSRTALSNLAGLRINPYPIAQEIRDAERRNAYAINRAGGLSGSQRYAALASQALGTQSNIAKMFSDVQMQNNAYKSNYANALLTSGEQAAQRRQNANQYVAESYDRAASRRATNYWKSMTGLGTAAQQAFANEFKYKTYKDTMNLYNRELDLQEQELLKKYNR